MLLEVFTGKRPTDPMFAGELNLREWINHAFPVRLVDVVDTELLQLQDDEANCSSNNNNSSEASSSRLTDLLVPIFELGLLCTRDVPDERSTMKDVVVKLKRVRKDYAASSGREQRAE